jgi:arylsulfatase A-like enzyme
MRIIYIDIDTLRPDHLGCYGYHRDTSPNIDRIAEEGLRLTECFVSDAPCLPSRSALHHGRFGIHNGAINHGGRYADPYPEGPTRGFKSSDPYLKWVQVLQKAGLYTATVSSFAGRHNSWWFLAGFNEVYDCGKSGIEIATEVTDEALQFLDRRGATDNWFLHFNIWDPHTPYRTPSHFGNPFENEPIADWVTEEMIQRHNDTFGTHSANAPLHNPTAEPTEREVSRIRTLEDYRVWIDGYDVGIRFADEAVGRICDKLSQLGIYEDTAIIVSSDHGENQGELNVYGDHQTADLITCRVPMIVKWPGLSAGVDDRFHYQFDVAATVLHLLGQEVPAKWDGESFADSLDVPSPPGKSGQQNDTTPPRVASGVGGVREKNEDTGGRDFLVISQACWSCQRAVIFDDYIMIKTYHDGLKDLPEIMLFDRRNDPHELVNIAGTRQDVVDRGLGLLRQWESRMIQSSDRKEDPMLGVIREGGPFHAKLERLHEYLDYYREIGREDIAAKMETRYAPHRL